MGPMGRRARRRGLIVGAAVGSARARRNDDNQADQAAPAAPAADDTTAQLTQLAALKDQGILTQEEFDAKKKQILGI